VEDSGLRARKETDFVMPFCRQNSLFYSGF
jgi:hypothetical protein